jgi:hypothetical protein
MAEKKKIGALWLKEQRGGGMHQTGEIDLPDGTKVPIIVFRNGFKTATNRQPDHIIYIREEQPQSQPTRQDDSDDEHGGAPSADEVF